MSATTTILELAAAAPEGTVFTPKGLLHLGSRASIDQALSRLVRAGALLRVGRGVYVRPVESRFGRHAPAAETVARGLGRALGETVVPSGAAEANALGLSTQVPVREIFLTSGRNRRLQLGRLQVEMRHAPGWQLHEAPVRALASVGPSRAHEAAVHLRGRLSSTERTALWHSRAMMPTWMAQTVSEVFAASV